MAETSENTNQVRWLVVGPVSSTPTEKTFTLDRSSFMEWVEERRFTCEIAGISGLGDRETEGVSFEVEKLSSLTLKNVTTAVPVLSKLLEVAGSVTDEKEAMAAVEGLVGAGALTDKIAKVAGIEAPKVSGGEGGDSSAEAILDAADMPKPQSMAANAIDAFLKTARTSSTTRRSKASRKVRDAIEEAVFTAAREAFNSPEVQRIESTLRGLKFLTDGCPSKAGIVVEVLDLPVEKVGQAIRDRERGDLVDEPDAIFVPHAMSDLGQIQELAELGEELLCPMIVEVAPAIFGQPDMTSMVSTLDAVDAGKAQSDWLALRQEESSRWLCCVSNPVVLFDEGTGAAKRVVTGSAVWALAAAISKSYSTIGSFARIIGRPGSINAPGVKMIDSGRYEGSAAPTDVFIPIRSQTMLAKHGITAVGSSRNSNAVVFAETPMTRATSDGVPLPAQILTGRIVRFAQWVRDQLPQGADADTARSVFQEASKIFLFPGMTDYGEVDANIVEEEGVRELRVYANISPALAGIPFEIGFPLPLD